MVLIGHVVKRRTVASVLQTTDALPDGRAEWERVFDIGAPDYTAENGFSVLVAISFRDFPEREVATDSSSLSLNFSLVRLRAPASLSGQDSLKLLSPKSCSGRTFSAAWPGGSKHRGASLPICSQLRFATLERRRIEFTRKEGALEEIHNVLGRAFLTFPCHKLRPPDQAADTRNRGLTQSQTCPASSWSVRSGWSVSSNRNGSVGTTQAVCTNGTLK